jgi:dGTPase
MKGTEPTESQRRRVEKQGSWDMRDAFSIDVDRILHSQAYTSYIDKTQVFYLVGHQGISHRVIHVQLLSRIARTIGRRLGLNDDLIEAIAIGHDIGHPPFGHDGERYLDELCAGAGIGPFLHNVQAIQSLERIEKGGKGLNLTLQVLDGILCHNGEDSEPFVHAVPCRGFEEFSEKIELTRQGLSPFPMTLEGGLVRIVDTVSYIGRDIEDAISLKIITRSQIPKEASSVLGDTNGKIVYALVEDLIRNSKEGRIGYSKKVFAALERLKQFNYEHIYLNPRVKTESTKIRTMYQLVFQKLLTDVMEENRDSVIFTRFLDRLDEGYRKDLTPGETVRDFIATLTDSAFLRIFNELFVPEFLE